MSETRSYNVLLTDTTAIYWGFRKYATPTDFAVAADWTPAAGDVKISKDGGAAANVTNLPSYVTDKGWKFILTAAELSCQQAVIRIADAATKVVCDDWFAVETSGNASAFWPDPSDAAPIYAQLSTTSLASVISGVWTRAMTELTSVPSITGTLEDALKWVFTLGRNKITQTSTTTLVRNSADNATTGTSTVSDDSVTFTRGKFS